MPSFHSPDADCASLYETEIFPFVEKPSRYIDHEINAARPDWSAARLRVALVFPDAYEVGVSHLGLKILYEILNALPGVIAERCYAPWPDCEALLRGKRIPLCSLETCHPLREFHVIGFSIQYELCYTNILQMLDLAGLPLRAVLRRGSPGPLVIAGGNVFSPGPLEPFIDAFAVGDGESMIAGIARWALDQMPHGGPDNAPAPLLTVSDELLAAFARAVPGIYVPSLCRRTLSAGHAMRSCPDRPSDASIPFPVRRQVELDLTEVPVVRKPLVPYCEAVHDRAAVEIMRGCVRGCRFCQAGMITRPVREKPADAVAAEALEAINASGYEDLTLSSLSSGDYSQIAPLLLRLLEDHRLAEDRTAISLPSLRIDSFDPALAQAIRKVRRTGFTFAPEAGSERLRRVINKQLSRDEILGTVRSVFDSGWQLVKVYFMIGLPTETDEDIDEMVALINDISSLRKGGKMRGCRVNVSVSSFVPKAFTPFQWAAFADVAVLRERQQRIQQGVRDRAVKLSFHKIELSRLEAVFARGDTQLADVVENAYRLGCRFDEWSDLFRPELWDQAFANAGIDPECYLAAIPEDAALPWDAIDTGVDRAFLLDEWDKAIAAAPTPACAAGPCNQCGIQRWFNCARGTIQR
ncbi:TIGR03960 family B12-binding radical SAM protein [bacterium]|nr:TIGR03960 family B12-binding radical SAM protein [bacterium]